MTVKIRPVRLEDCGAIAQLFHELDEYHKENLPSFFQTPHKPFRTQEFLRGRLENEDIALFLAERRRIVGFVSVTLFESPLLPIFIPQKRASISDIYVHPEVRREGLARKLLKCAEEWAATKGAVGIDLTVYEFNTNAAQLFVEMGYSILSSRMSKDII